MRRFVRSSAIVAAALVLACAAQADLKSFMKKPEPSYSWKLEDTKHQGGVTIYKLHLVSQVWHGFKWEHDLVLFRPDKSAHPEFCGLHNTGGHAGGGYDAVGSAFVKQSGLSFAILYGIPMQPIWGKTEDALVVATWQKYIETGDPSWPLHFPMAKACIKAMDALQAFSKKQCGTKYTRFLVNGGSKRGWTSWLVGATQDPRVVAICPMVIDTLNVAKQIPHQLKMYGQPSEEIADYSGAGMLNLIGTPRGKSLMQLEDPYSYRNILTLPKLLILGTNDPYWAPDALNIYWNDLKGPKWVLYTPNSGHGLDDRMRVVATLSAFMRTIANHKPWPQIVWKHTGPGTDAKVVVDSNVAPVSARVWRAESDTTDFRKSKFVATEAEMQGKHGVFSLPAAASGYAVSFVELTFNLDGKPFNLSTQNRVLPNTK